MKSKYSAYAHLEKMQNAKKPIHRFYRLRLAHAVDTMVNSLTYAGFLLSVWRGHCVHQVYIEFNYMGA